MKNCQLLSNLWLLERLDKVNTLYGHKRKHHDRTLISTTQEEETVPAESTKDDSFVSSDKTEDHKRAENSMSLGTSAFVGPTEGAISHTAYQEGSGVSIGSSAESGHEITFSSESESIPYFVEKRYTDVNDSDMRLEPELLLVESDVESIKISSVVSNLSTEEQIIIDQDTLETRQTLDISNTAPDPTSSGINVPSDVVVDGTASFEKPNDGSIRNTSVGEDANEVVASVSFHDKNQSTVPILSQKEIQARRVADR
jgi:hypothetical protein